MPRARFELIQENPAGYSTVIVSVGSKRVSAGTRGTPESQVALGDVGSWWARQDLNLGPTDYESAALTAELRAPRDITS
jgi:hypothetical protein